MTGERRSWTAALCCCMGWALTAAPAVAAPASLTLDVPDLGEPVGIAADLSEGRYWVTDGTTSGRTTVVSVGDDGKLGTKLNWQAPTTDVQACPGTTSISTSATSATPHVVGTTSRCCPR